MAEIATVVKTLVERAALDTLVILIQIVVVPMNIVVTIIVRKAHV